MAEFLRGLSKVTIEEQLDQSDADTLNVLEFNAPIEAIEIWHNEATPQEFTVNGIVLSIIPGGYRSSIGGTPSAEVTIPGGVDCIVARLV